MAMSVRFGPFTGSVRTVFFFLVFFFNGNFIDLQRDAVGRVVHWQRSEIAN